MSTWNPSHGHFSSFILNCQNDKVERSVVIKGYRAEGINSWSTDNFRVVNYFVCVCVCVCSHAQELSHSVTFDPLLPHGLDLPHGLELFCPWDSPGKNTGVGCHSHLWGIFLTQGWNLGLLHCRWILYLSYLGSPNGKMVDIYHYTFV